jgi:tripartite ATP-independent transporter DctM subunit
MDPGIITLLLLGSLLLFLSLGVPVAFAMGGLSIIFAFFFWDGISSIDAFSLGTYSKVMNFTLSAGPLYILMAALLRYSDLAEDMYEAIYRWFGGLRGGLAVGTTIISSMFAAMVGIATVATATLGVTARPSMLKRGYDDKLTIGAIVAGGALGILIPPSVIMIIYAVEAEASPGAMFLAGIIPGVLAAVLFIIYVLILCWIYPNKGPALAKEERFTWAEKIESFRGVILPTAVIVIVLGSIYFGVATPTEAAAVGVFGSFICLILKRKMTMANIKKIFVMTVSLNGLVFWIIIGAIAYSKIVIVTGVGGWLSGLITGLDVPGWVMIVAMQLLLTVLGMFIDPIGILYITGPLFLPVITTLGYDPVWYGVLFVINMCIAYLTPPFGFNLFVMKGVAPDLDIRKIYKAVWPFVGLYALVILLCIIFPELILWLPSQMVK